MAGTKEGGMKAAAINMANDPNFYARIGAIGGKNGRTGGFAADVDCDDRKCPYLKEYRQTHFIRQCAGYIGGLTSRRGKRVNV